MQNESAEKTCENSESSLLSSCEHKIEDEWFLVDKNAAAATVDFEVLGRGGEVTSSVTSYSKSVNNQNSSNKNVCVTKKPKAKKVETSLVLDWTVSQKEARRPLDESEMPKPDEKSEEALKTRTYDAIEDSMYSELDKDHSTGSGRRVHTGNYRMKQSSAKATTKDANDDSTSDQQPKQ